MSNTIGLFSDAAISIAEKLRLMDDLYPDDVETFYCLFDDLCVKYKNIAEIPKSLAFDILNLTDSLEGAMQIYTGEREKEISKINSKVRMYIEKLLLD